DDGRCCLGRELLQDAESVPFRHLHVKEEKRRPQLADLRHRFVSIARLADYGHLRERGQKRPDSLPRQGLVVRDHCAERGHVLPPPIGLRGIVTATSVPNSGFRLSAMAPRVPYSCSS